MYAAVARLRSAATLPVGLGSVIVLFYAALAITGTSLEEARAGG
jgi:hypothetical protein